MKDIKLIKSLILIIVIFITAGCSDTITSSEHSGNNNESGGKSKINKTSEIKDNNYHTKISIKPHEEISFSFENTGYYTFNSISVLNCGILKNNFEIVGYCDDTALLLGCNSNGFKANQITIHNKSSETINLELFLSGSKVRTIKKNYNTAE